MMKIREFINKYFDTIETILILGFAAGMIMILKEMHYAFWVLRISLGALAILYWSKTTERKENQPASEKISEKVMWYSLIITPIAIIGKLQFSENANAFLLFSLGALFFAGGYRIFERKKAKEKINTGEITRLLIAAILAFSLFTLPLPSIN
ncbi:MAG: hypothetical protein JXL97_01420 [Bacteroidales bacterium]|nr:hypothetical protein [Bacteroidales bacterium]